MNKCVFYFFFLLSLTGVSQNSLEQANRFIEEQRYDQARKILEIEITRNYSGNVKELLGDVYGLLKKWDKAITVYGELVQDNPESANYHYKYGGVIGMKALSVNKLKAFGYLDDIKKHFEMASKLDSKHIGARWALIEYYIQLPGIIGGSAKKARYYAKELKAIKKIEGLLAEAYIAHYKKNNELARKKSKEAILLAHGIPKNYERNTIHYQLGKIASRYGIMSETGIKHLQWYRENYTPNDSVTLEWIYYHLARIYRHKNERENALKWINKAIVYKDSFKEAIAERKLIEAL